MGTGTNDIDKRELKHWLKWSLICASPAIISFLTSLQGVTDIKMVWPMTLQAILSSLIILVRTYVSDNSK